MSAAVHPNSEVRRMLPADLKSVARIEHAAYRYPWSHGIFRDCLLAGYQCLVLEAGGLTTGYGVMSVASGEAHLLNLCVHPSSQRLGYGRRLLNELLFRAEGLKAERVFLEVRPTNAAALALYRSATFERIGVRPSYYQADSGREDAVVLALALHAPE